MNIKEKVLEIEYSIQNQYKTKINNDFINKIKKLKRNGDVINFIKSVNRYFNSEFIKKLKNEGQLTSDEFIKNYLSDEYLLDYSRKSDYVVDEVYNSMEKCALSQNFNQQIGMQYFYDKINGHEFVVITVSFDENNVHSDEWIIKEKILKYAMQKENRVVEMPGDLINKPNRILATNFFINNEIDILLFEKIYTDVYKYLGEYIVVDVDLVEKYFILSNKSINKNILNQDFGKFLESNKGEKYRTYFSKSRIGQDIFRTKLVDKYQSCVLCGVTFTRILIASHIKPFSLCDTSESLDVNNGLLLCPNHDKLFDKGLITFDSKGRLLISKELTQEQRILLNIHAKSDIKISIDMERYMDFHRKNIFKDKGIDL